MKRLVVVAGLIAVALVAVAFFVSRRGSVGPAGSDVGRAAERGDAAALKALAAAGADVEARDGGLTPLMFAARAGDEEAVRVLLDARADPNARDCGAQGWTPLIHAIHKHQSAAARALVERGADVNARAGNCSEQLVESGRTPLMYAAMHDDAEMVKFLIERGADARAEHDGSNALSYAVGGGALGKLADLDRAVTHPCPVETVKALLSRAPDLEVGDGPLNRASVFVLKKKCPELASLLEGRAGSKPSAATSPAPPAPVGAHN